MTSPSPQGPLLAIDSGSPRVSVAIGSASETLATRDAPAVRSSAAIMGLIDSCLAEVGLQPPFLAGIVVLSGPGSFTGLRVGMSIALGFHQALGLPGGAISSFRALASQATDPGAPVLAAIRALRSEWYVRRFETPAGPGGEPERLDESELLERAPRQIVGFDLAQIVRRVADEEEITWIESGPLAVTALSLVEHVRWGPAALTAPAYMAPPPVHSRPAGEPD